MILIRFSVNNYNIITIVLCPINFVPIYDKETNPLRRSGTKCDWLWVWVWLWVRFPLEEIKYLFKFIFPFLRSGGKAKREV